MKSPFHQITFFYRENVSKKLFQTQRWARINFIADEHYKHAWINTLFESPLKRAFN